MGTGETMLWTLVVVFLILWLLGFSFSVGGNPTSLPPVWAPTLSPPHLGGGRGGRISNPPPPPPFPPHSPTGPSRGFAGGARASPNLPPPPASPARPPPGRPPPPPGPSSAAPRVLGAHRTSPEHIALSGRARPPRRRPPPPPDRRPRLSPAFPGVLRLLLLPGSTGRRRKALMASQPQSQPAGSRKTARKNSSCCSGRSYSILPRPFCSRTTIAATGRPVSAPASSWVSRGKRSSAAVWMILQSPASSR